MAQQLLARQYSKYLMRISLGMTGLMALVAVISHSSPLPAVLASLLRWPAILVAALVAAFARWPENVFPIIKNIHERFVGNNAGLVEAARNSDEKFLKQMFPDAATANKTDLLGLTPLHAACESNNDVGITHLLAVGANPNVKTAKGDTPYSLTLQFGSLYSINQLKGKGAAFEPGDGGVTELMYHAALSKADTFALQIGRDRSGVQATCHQGMTPLHFAALYGQLENFELLLKCGAKVGAVTKRGESVLHIAARSLSGFNVMNKILSDHKGLLSGVTNEGFTPLMCAVESTNPASVYFLLRISDLSAKDRRGRTAEDIAKEINNPFIMNEFQQYYSAQAQKTAQKQAQKAAQNVLNAAVQSGGASVTQSSSQPVTPSQPAPGSQATNAGAQVIPSQPKFDRDQCVNQVLECLEAEGLFGLDSIGSRLGKDLGEFVLSGQRSKVRLFWGAPETGKTKIAQRLMGKGSPISPMLDLPIQSHLVYITGQDIVEKKLDLKATLIALSKKSVIVIDDADIALDPEVGAVSAQDSKIYIRSILTAMNQHPCYFILIGNFQKRRGGYEVALQPDHLVQALGSDFADLIDHKLWEFKPLSEKALLQKFGKVLRASGYEMTPEALVAAYVSIIQKNKTRPLVEFEKIVDRIVVEREVATSPNGLKLISLEDVKETVNG